MKFWTRKEFKGSNELKRRVKPTRVPIGQKESVRGIDELVETIALLGDPGRCVHIGDRGADIYELFCAANDVGAHFVIRSAYQRLEAAHRFAGSVTRGSDRKTELVCGAMENRALLQNPEIRLPGRGIAAAHRAAFGESHRDLLCRCVAEILADDDQSQPTRGCADVGAHPA